MAASLWSAAIEASKRCTPSARSRTGTTSVTCGLGETAALRSGRGCSRPASCHRVMRSRSAGVASNGSLSSIRSINAAPAGVSENKRMGDPPSTNLPPEPDRRTEESRSKAGTLSTEEATLTTRSARANQLQTAAGPAAALRRSLLPPQRMQPAGHLGHHWAQLHQSPVP